MNYAETAKRNGSVRGKRRRTELKLAVIKGYGGACTCCGETNPIFLTIDHVNGDGAQDRRKGLKAGKLAVKLIQQGFPSGYQILCWNCNLGRQLNGGVCPHQEVVLS